MFIDERKELTKDVISKLENRIGGKMGGEKNCDQGDKGIYHKFNVSREDETDVNGGKHEGCDYFVLDLTHDRFAPIAIRGYIIACTAGGYMRLANDLLSKLEDMEKRFSKPEE